MSNNLVAYSRAGDVFHYRWAARRCLKLLHFNTTLETVVIEGSIEDEKEGEYVIDVAEYHNKSKSKKFIEYYQLKHTTTQKNIPFQLSDLKDTFEGFSKRFVQHKAEENAIDFSFTIVTNRPFDKSFKQNINLLSNEKTTNKRFENTLLKYTKLSIPDLYQFCKCLKITDSEGDYNIQKDELRIEIAQLVTGSVDNAQIENIVSLVQEKVTALQNNRIIKEDILMRFGITSDQELFPAPPIWEAPDKIIIRQHHQEIIKSISNSLYPIIVHAHGGVGKSVFCRQLIDSLPSNSIGIAYDCFGAGRYRNSSEPRHTHRSALVQIVNELAVKGLCDPLLIQDTSLNNDLMRKFLWRIESAVESLKQINQSSLLFILIDAADNAEMAAQEYSNSCFANELLRETIPEGCRLILLSRTERIELLKPNSKILKLELEPFSESETLINLQRWFPEATNDDGSEFHRLTNGNPRVQANALNVEAFSISELLSKLGPTVITVEKQIETQLNAAISKIKDSLAESYQKQIEAICLGLASLPPHIPIKILAKAAEVSTETIKSFVADFGRSLWVLDESVQFRDEPTETWFRKTYLGNKENFEIYINLLEPLAENYTYVAEVLPHLYLQAEKYDKLIKIALSDDYLPKDNPIDARNVRVYRLQFAFRASLKIKQYYDSIKIAVRAGEEVAGNERQLALFRNNIDLLVLLQDKQKVQDIAFKRLLSSNWNGSENIYSASLLSGVSEYKGEARGYLRAAINWLEIYYRELKKSENSHHENEVHEGDILELSFAIFNIYGAKKCVDFLNRFTSKTFTFDIIGNLARRFIDVGNFEFIDEFLEICIKQPYFTVAIVNELIKIGRFPEEKLIKTCLVLLCCSKFRIEKPQHSYDENITTAIVSFLEACLYKNLPAKQLSRVLKHYVPQEASRMVYGSHQSKERTIYLKALAIRIFIEGKTEIDIDDILPKSLINVKEKNKIDRSNDVKEFNEVINGLFPWYFLRTKILSKQKLNFENEVNNANQKSIKARSSRYLTYDNLPNEIAGLQSSILIFNNNGKSEEIDWFYSAHIKDNKSLLISDELNTVRAAFRLTHLNSIEQALEQAVYARIKNIKDDGPDEAALRYISLARAVLITSVDDASVYFDEAVKIISKFGDELVRRWEAIVSLAKQSSNENSTSEELAFRFIRCAEVVGDYVSREKHWDRGEAIAICTRMSTGQGISALSRWRDRDVGRFEYELEELLKELVQSHKISSSTGWSMSRLFSNHQLNHLLSICLKNEPDEKIKDKIFADAIHLLQIEGTTSDYWKGIHQIASQQNIQNTTLEEILSFHQTNDKVSSEQKEISSESKQLDKEEVKEDLFNNRNVLSAEQFSECLGLFKIIRKNSFINFDIFWKEILLRLEEKNLWQFINILLTTELNTYEIKSFFSVIPDKWKSRISFQKKWIGLIRKLGVKYSYELIAPYSFNYFVTEFHLDANEIDHLKEGVFEGLENGYEFSTAEMFFGFVGLAAPVLNSSKAADLLDFTLSRFEIHIEKEFGDGEWTGDLSTSEIVYENVANFIWSALGSPRSAERWNATHTVKALDDFNCVEIINELIPLLQQNEIKAFGHRKFHFYKLHARLYLLIVLAKISVHKPESLVGHKETFIHFAFKEPHALIQNFALEILINISNSLQNIFNDEILDLLINSRQSKFDLIEDEENYFDSYLHLHNKVNQEYDYHFGLDIGNYWLEPLGDVFGISEKHVKDLVADVIINEWKLGNVNCYYDDPRSVLWNNSSGERETYYYKSDYPKTDNFDFYLVYHAMFVVAAKLFENMPIIKNADYAESKWNYWILRHSLTCSNTNWLSDFRDPVPIERPKWINENNGTKWNNEFPEEHFFQMLLSDDNDEQWINVYGGWEEKSGEKIESFSIRSALVSKETSSSLMRALESCSDPHDYKLPEYDEQNMEIDEGVFDLKGWIISDSASLNFDKYDPYADNIFYPAYSIGDDIINRLDLTLDHDEKTWYSSLSKYPSIKCEIWSSYRRDKDENPNQSGTRLRTSLSFIQHLCSTLNRDLILEVSIDRKISYKYRNYDHDKEYVKPKYKIFTITSNGELRSTRENFKLG